MAKKRKKLISKGGLGGGMEPPRPQKSIQHPQITLDSKFQHTLPEPPQPISQPNPTQPNPTQPNPTQPNPTQPNPTQPNPTQPNPTQQTIIFIKFRKSQKCNYIRYFTKRTKTWMSPLLPMVNPTDEDDEDDDSRTNFKADLVHFLGLYKQDCLTSWIDALKKRNFNNVDAFLIPSFPGSHRGQDMKKFGLGKMAEVLKEHATALNPALEWKLVAQTSSIGSLGETADKWLFSEFLSAFSEEVVDSMSIVYPTMKERDASFEAAVDGSEKSGSCLSYSVAENKRQPWLQEYLWLVKTRGVDPQGFFISIFFSQPLDHELNPQDQQQRPSGSRVALTPDSPTPQQDDAMSEQQDFPLFQVEEEDDESGFRPSPLIETPLHHKNDVDSVLVLFGSLSAVDIGDRLTMDMRGIKGQPTTQTKLVANSLFGGQWHEFKIGCANGMYIYCIFQMSIDTDLASIRKNFVIRVLQPAIKLLPVNSVTRAHGAHLPDMPSDRSISIYKNDWPAIAKSVDQTMLGGNVLKCRNVRYFVAMHGLKSRSFDTIESILKTVISDLESPDVESIEIHTATNIATDDRSALVLDLRRIRHHEEMKTLSTTNPYFLSKYGHCYGAVRLAKFTTVLYIQSYNLIIHLLKLRSFVCVGSLLICNCFRRNGLQMPKDLRKVGEETRTYLRALTNVIQAMQGGAPLRIEVVEKFESFASFKEAYPSNAAFEEKKRRFLDFLVEERMIVRFSPRQWKEHVALSGIEMDATLIQGALDTMEERSDEATFSNLEAQQEQQEQRRFSGSVLQIRKARRLAEQERRAQILRASTEEVHDGFPLDTGKVDKILVVYGAIQRALMFTHGGFLSRHKMDYQWFKGMISGNGGYKKAFAHLHEQRREEEQGVETETPPKFETYPEAVSHSNLAKGSVKLALRVHTAYQPYVHLIFECMQVFDVAWSERVRASDQTTSIFWFLTCVHATYASRFKGKLSNREVVLTETAPFSPRSSFKEGSVKLSGFVTAKDVVKSFLHPNTTFGKLVLCAMQLRFTWRNNATFKEKLVSLVQQHVQVYPRFLLTGTERDPALPQWQTIFDRSPDDWQEASECPRDLNSSAINNELHLAKCRRKTGLGFSKERSNTAAAVATAVAAPLERPVAATPERPGAATAPKNLGAYQQWENELLMEYALRPATLERPVKGLDVWEDMRREPRFNDLTGRRSTNSLMNRALTVYRDRQLLRRFGVTDPKIVYKISNSLKKKPVGSYRNTQMLFGNMCVYAFSILNFFILIPVSSKGTGRKRSYQGEGAYDISPFQIFNFFCGFAIKLCSLFILEIPQLLPPPSPPLPVHVAEIMIHRPASPPPSPPLPVHVAETMVHRPASPLIPLPPLSTNALRSRCESIESESDISVSNVRNDNVDMDIIDDSDDSYVNEDTEYRVVSEDGEGGEGSEESEESEHSEDSEHWDDSEDTDDSEDSEDGHLSLVSDVSDVSEVTDVSEDSNDRIVGPVQQNPKWSDQEIDEIFRELLFLLDNPPEKMEPWKSRKFSMFLLDRLKKEHRIHQCRTAEALRSKIFQIFGKMDKFSINRDFLKEKVGALIEKYESKKT
ncbi:unnamed protein product [Brassicogethes aeneus]|uniref:Uncharacterized protein n=1 Tax=Brassicogethes aeneus TaxID=1431903 RepID=A0A9P0B6H4_BRAAE|nr:unnamed protein product [Brassicogethes aeneus]